MVIINNMNVPKTCGECKLKRETYTVYGLAPNICCILDKEVDDNSKLEHCPLENHKETIDEIECYNYYKEDIKQADNITIKYAYEKGFMRGIATREKPPLNGSLVRSLVAYYGQHDVERFKPGDKIRYDPVEIGNIIDHYLATGHA